jgi:hypothetical protein
MNPLLELRDRLVPKPVRFVGKITAIDGAGVSVRGPSGVVRASSSAALTLAVGDEVFVKDGAIQGRVGASESVTVYRL